MFGFHKLPKARFSPLDLTSWMVDRRAGRQNWLQGRLAELPCNLPEQLQALMLNGAGADGQDHGPVTRRAMLELLPSATVRMVPYSQAMPSSGLACCLRDTAVALGSSALAHTIQSMTPVAPPDETIWHDQKLHCDPPIVATNFWKFLASSYTNQHASLFQRVIIQ